MINWLAKWFRPSTQTIKGNGNVVSGDGDITIKRLRAADILNGSIMYRADYDRLVASGVDLTGAKIITYDRLEK